MQGLSLGLFKEKMFLVREEIKCVRKILTFSDFHYQRSESCAKYTKMQLHILTSYYCAVFRCNIY